MKLRIMLFKVFLEPQLIQPGVLLVLAHERKRAKLEKLRRKWAKRWLGLTRIAEDSLVDEIFGSFEEKIKGEFNRNLNKIKERENRN